MTANLNRLARYFGGRGKARQPKAGGEKYTIVHTDADVPLPRTLNKEERLKAKRTEVREERDLQFERYLGAREYRKAKLQEAHPSVRRYLKHLARLEQPKEAVEASKKHDCDIDLAELASRCGLPDLPSDSDRFFLYELTSEWLHRIRKRQYNGKVPVCEDDDFFNPRSPFEGTALGELRTLLQIR